MDVNRRTTSICGSDSIHIPSNKGSHSVLCELLDADPTTWTLGSPVSWSTCETIWSMLPRLLGPPVSEMRPILIAGWRTEAGKTLLPWTVRRKPSSPPPFPSPPPPPPLQSHSQNASDGCIPEARGEDGVRVHRGGRAGHALVQDCRLHKDLGVGKYITSATFAVGGHGWRLRYCPDGAKEDLKDYTAVFLELATERVKQVRVKYDFRLVHPATGLSSSVFSAWTLYDRDKSCWGARNWKKTSDLEASFLQDDCLVIECDVTVMKESRLEETETAFEVQLPPSDLSDNLGKFLDSGEGADVTFTVKGEVFGAHKFMLAARSAVFRAEFYGPMMMDKETKSSITIEDMEPAAFKALLHFIYKDSLPAMDGLDADENEEMVKHLLVAADRYAVERMKLMCESILCKRLHVGTAAATLEFADQHHCSKLKDACSAFITSSDRINDVVASQEYQHLKRACPAVFVDVWEKAAMSRKS
ncbi:hypothetical protein C2845_PM13G06990 [Panicum miliaceum]|uniref:BTB/POZ and MATH domain-containing protein 2-like n=1 Tax=Panicum miliaceum TaxID=4540 RepID=A0A3L6RKB7_PANMI|nr:hypothetical protein C2845_PM13G06990 [Panicum miliaceum]